MYILLCGYPPFNGGSDKQIIQAVLAGKYSIDEPEWAEVSADAKDIVKLLLMYEPDKRISAQAALSHPWLKKMATNEKVHKDIAI